MSADDLQKIVNSVLEAAERERQEKKRRLREYEQARITAALNLKEELDREWAERERRAKILRFMPYSKFLKSTEWKTTKAAALRRAGFRCQACNSAGPLDVHHRTYDRRGSEYPSDLIALCSACHELFHKNGRLAASEIEHDRDVIDSTYVPGDG